LVTIPNFNHTQYVEKYCTVGQITNDNTAHAHCMLDNKAYRHTEYVTLIALPMQLWLNELSLTLRYTCISTHPFCCGAGDTDLWRSCSGSRQALVSGAACSKMAAAATLNEAASNDIVRTGAANYIAQI
jgi:hypothetical protein